MTALTPATPRAAARSVVACMLDFQEEISVGKAKKSIVLEVQCGDCKIWL